MISLRTHNVLDYAIAAALVLVPYLFGFSEVPFARDAFLAAGLGLAGYSAMTDYLHSLAKIIPLGIHMTFDVVTGFFIMAAPFVYGYREELTGFQYALHFALGLGAIALVVFTRRGTGMRPIGVLERSETEQPLRKAA